MIKQIHSILKKTSFPSSPFPSPQPLPPFYILSKNYINDNWMPCKSARLSGSMYCGIQSATFQTGDIDFYFVFIHPKDGDDNITGLVVACRITGR